jgi:hypothetical protein
VLEASPGHRLRALDTLGRYGDLVYSETDARMDSRVDAGPTYSVIVCVPDNGRGQGPRTVPIAARIKEPGKPDSAAGPPELEPLSG